MIATIDIDLNAENPQMPLGPFFAYVGSPSSVRIRNVPRKIGSWEITKVFVSANYPDNTIQSRECKLVGGLYVATLPACALVGKSALGLTVSANGIDENGDAVTGYVLGKGDFEILSSDGTVTPGVTTHYIHVLQSRPENPQTGDAYTDSGTWYFYNGNSWVTLGGVSAGNAYIESPLSEGGDGLWHRMYIVDGTIAYDSEGVEEPPLAADKPWVSARIAVVADALTAHLADTDNPHSVTKSQVGLGNVDNTSDANKPVSTAQAAAIAAVGDALAAHKADTANPHSVTKSQVGLGNVDNTSDANKPVSTAQGAAIAAVGDALVAHKADTANPHSVTKSQVGLGNVDNTSDANKPVSTAQAAAIAAEAARAEGAESELNDAIVGEAARAAAAEAMKVPLDGPATVNGVKTFTSSPIVPSPGDTSNNSTKAANTAWITAKLPVWWAALLAAGVTVPSSWKFASRIYQEGTFAGSAGGLRTVFDDVERGIAPSAEKMVQYNFCGHTDAQNLMMLLMTLATSGQRSIVLRAISAAGTATDFLTGILSMDGSTKRLIACGVPLENVGTPTANNHAATKGYVDGLDYGNAAMPRSTYSILSVPESGNNIEFSTGVTAAPSACWVSYVHTSGAAGEYVTLENGAVISTAYATASGQNLRIYIPVAKGNSVKLTYTATGSTFIRLRVMPVRGLEV